MPPADRPDPTHPAEWLLRANSSLRAARAVLGLPGILYEEVCFHAQQAAEKALKSILVSRKSPFPKTHEIGALLTLVVQSGTPVPDNLHSVERLSRFAIETRYPGVFERVTQEECAHALEMAERVVRWAESLI